MTTNSDMTPIGSMQKVTETIIRLGVLALLVAWCFQILQPFIIPIVWGIIIAVAIYPLYERLVKLLRGRRNFAATLMTILILVLLLFPAVMLTKRMITNTATLASQFRDEQLVIPPPPESVKEWPIVGARVTEVWHLAATNLTQAIDVIRPQIRGFGAWLVKLAASASLGLIMFVFSVIIAGVLLAHSTGSQQVAHGIARRLIGEKRGDDFANLAGATIRSVTRGILGIAVIQSLMAGLGFMVGGVPGAGILSLLCLILAVVQIGVGPVVIPVVIYMFVTGDNTLHSVLFLIWNSLVLVTDNILKPLLLGRGVDVPMVVIFLGAIGGLLMSGIVGLFVGAIVLALGYKLFQIWFYLDSKEGDASMEK